MKRYWEIIADNLSKAGWSWGCVSALDRKGHTIWIVAAHRGDGKRFVAVASANRSTACCNARMAARRRSHPSVPVIEDDRALELRGTRARHPGPRRHKAPTARASHAAQLSAPALHFPTPRARG
jgi:hypothetical protein